MSNPRGGFYGFWWGSWESSEHGRAYLQLESSTEGARLVFRVHCPDEAEQSEVRETWLARVKEAAKDHPTLTVGKPKKFGSGETMTFAELSGDYREEGPDLCVDLDKTVTNLRAAQDILERAAGAMG